MASTTALPGAYRALLDMVGKVEPRICQTVRDELTGQRASLKLIASENYASLPVFATMGTWLSDKYTEGAVGHRFYTGCQDIDVMESVAAKHARGLFDAGYTYAQPHSGIDTSLTAYWAILAHHIETPALTESGSRNVPELSETDRETLRARFGSQRLLSIGLGAGGHLTHESRPNVSGKMFHQRSCDTNPTTELLGYDALAAQAVEFRLLVVVAGYSAYPRHIDFAKMRKIADSVDMVLMVDITHFAGLMANKVFTDNGNPVPFAQVMITTIHKSLRDPRGDLVLVTEDYVGDVNRGCPMVLDNPLSRIIAAKAVALTETRIETFRDYVHRVVDDARALAEGLLKRGGTLVTGGTDDHIVLPDVSSFGLAGQQAESALLDSGIITNHSSVPNDSSGTWYASGIRLDTPTLTSRGFATSNIDKVMTMITDVLKKITPTIMKDGKPGRAKYGLAQEVADGSKDRAAKLLNLHPLYPSLAL